MAPRRRSREKDGWPDNLYERNGYYSWRNPADGKEYGIGRDRRLAFDQANEANLHITGQLPVVRVVDRLTGEDKRTVKAWLDQYDATLKKRERKDRRIRTPGSLAPSTLKQYLHFSQVARRELGENTKMRGVTALMCSDMFTRIIERGTDRAADGLRQFLRECFREAKVNGWMDINPVADIRLVKAEVKRARLEFPVFMSAYRQTKRTWLRNAMAIGLVTGQRREDIAKARFADVKKDGWYCEQWKTGNRRVIPLELRLDVFGMSLEDVMKQCRATGCLSKHLVHQTERRARSPVGAPMALATITEVFSQEIEALEIDWGDKDPPSFHEIRSLCKRLYIAQGGIDTKALLGHESDQAAALYEDTRSRDWVRIDYTVPGNR